jgi:hypothetical protein
LRSGFIFFVQSCISPNHAATSELLDSPFRYVHCLLKSNLFTFIQVNHFCIICAPRGFGCHSLILTPRLRSHAWCCRFISSGIRVALAKPLRLYIVGFVVLWVWSTLAGRCYLLHRY